MAHDPLSDSLISLLQKADPLIAGPMAAERKRQETTIELIASENHVSPAVMHTMGSWLTNKYAEGYPGARYYGGCIHNDEIENIARDRAKSLFGCNFANVQPHSGAQANTAAFMALLKPGDTFCSLVLKDGGHLSHGMSINFSGVFFKPVFYPLHYEASHPEFERIDYDAVRKVCLEHKPKLLLCGYSAYPRTIDFAKFRAIADECGALLMADVAHIAGLCTHNGCAHPSPFPHAHIVTTTTHKTLRGPRGGLIMTNDEELAKKIDKAVFPGVQGGPLMHVIAAKAVAFGEALRPDFVTYCKKVVANAQALAAALTKRGYRITTGGTDNHLMLVDLRPKNADLTGADAEKWLEAAGLICNKNGIPSDPRPPKFTSGLRLGSPATTTRGFGTSEMETVAGFIDRVLTAKGDAGETERVRAEVATLCAKFPNARLIAGSFVRGVSMLTTLLVACAICQPPSAAAPPKGEAPPAAAEPKAPAPLGTVGVRELTDAMIGRGIGGYTTALQMIGWAGDANPGDAEAVARLRERWEAEAKPGYEALVRLMGRRKGVDDAQVLAELEPVLRRDVEEVKEKLTPAALHTLVTEGRLSVREQPSQIAAFWYMMDPSRGGDDSKLLSSGKTRKVRAALTAEGGKNTGLELTVPLSWAVVTDKPGELTVAENAGVGPLSITINGFPLPKQAEHDPVKLVAIMVTTPENPKPETSATKLAGKPAGRGSRLLVLPREEERVCGYYTFTVSTDGGLAVSVAATVAAPAKAGERDYTTEELAAYSQKHSAVIDAVLGSMSYVDIPPVPAGAAGSSPKPAK